ncbi:DUF2207 domain-containing protein [Virgibacillus halodenitrificans]|uniref:DUF2207 domain-containing protein n=1 Tax=Virgibacillus halodenitrificans TaxID=1482 RepID=UPI001FB40449|nr:DUF2207 domain-containing protein [Virgibacillus halodenitrificans]MCJ0932012.1 DUF2207 domain-containing protein [Virgibacillus halodenitrificans]
MKKIFGLVIIIFSILVFPIESLAVDYSIDNSQIDAYLQPDGNVMVTEKHTYQFEGEFNGITRTLIPKKNTKIIDVTAEEKGSKLDIEQEDNLYKIHRKGENETITIEIFYTIENGVEVFSDVAQFYWPFFDESNESDYGNMNIFVHPPEKTGNVIAYGKDAAADSADTQRDGRVHFSMGQVDSGANGDIRVAYDASLFPNAPIAKDQAMKQDILADKENLEKEQAAFEHRQDLLSGMAPFVIGVFVFYLLALLVYAVKQRRAVQLEVEHQYVSAHFVPDLMMSLPATLSFMKSGLFDANVLTASLLDLVRKGYVKKEKEDTFSIIHMQTDYQHENILLDWLFYKIGDNGTFHLKNLKDYTDDESNHETYWKDFEAWKQAVKEEVKTHRLIDKQTKLRTIIGLSSIIVVPFAVLFGVHELFVSMFFAIMLFGALLIFAALFRYKTVKGAILYKQWKEFQEKYPAMNDKDWQDLHNDDQKRAFIYSIGLNDKQLDKKNEQIKEVLPQNDRYNADILSFLLIASLVQNQFEDSHTVSAATTSSGGSPGGGAGVGGGGGGSGAF